MLYRAWRVALAVTAAFAATLPAPARAGAPLPTDRHDRPFPMGISIGNTSSAPYLYGGTAGLRVRPFGQPSSKMILSNNHVLGALGPTLCPNTASAGVRVLQPGTLDIGFDAGTDPFYLGGIVAARVPIDFGAGTSNLVDAAVAFTTASLARTEIQGIGEPNPALRFPALGMTVAKSGRTTGVTSGVISAVNVTSSVSYGSGCGSARFVNQFSISDGTFSDPGDSGAAILDDTDNTPVGLLFAGNATRTIANPMPFVYLTLGVFVDMPGAPSSREQVVAEATSLMQDAPEMARIKAIQRRAEPGLFAIPGVVGVGIGFSDDGENLALVIYTSEISARARSALPRAIEGSPVEIIAGGEFEAR